MKPLNEKPNDRLANVFALGFGAFLGLALLKFGNPCILEKLVDQPTNALEWLMNPWPQRHWVSQSILLVLVLAPLVCTLISQRNQTGRRPSRKPAVGGLLFLWILWQAIPAYLATVNLDLTQRTVQHFMQTSMCLCVG